MNETNRMQAFKNLPDTARLWVYAANRPINLEEHEYIFARLSHFVEEWQAHGAKLAAEFTLLHRRFILIAVDEGPQNATGCSIDACVHEIQAIGQSLGIDFLNRLQVVYRDEANNMVVSCSIAELKSMIANHDFPKSTPIFNTGITTVGQLRAGWEIPAMDSWLQRYFQSANA